jgi:excinuclease UvrABC ATPase subunit
VRGTLPVGSGGRIVVAGTPAAVAVDKDSVTGPYLARHLSSLRYSALMGD